MDIPVGIYLNLLFTFTLISGLMSSQLYLQPSKDKHGYFTNESFFITCFTTDENIDQLSWVDINDNKITATEGRIHVQPADGNQRGLRLVFSHVEKQDAGTYTCSDLHLSVSFDLIVYRAISFGDTPKIQHAPEGQTATVVCHIKSDPPPAVYWYFNGTTIKDSKDTKNPKYKIEDNGLTIHNLSRSDAGDYKCKGFVITALSTNINEIDINLHVQYSPEFMEDQKKVAYATIGSLANLSCSVSADPYPMFQWIRDEETLHNSTDYRIFNTNNQSILQMTVEDQYQLGDYICRASNNHGWKEVTIDLREGNPPIAPKLSVDGEDQGIVKLKLEQSENIQDHELRVTGFKVEYLIDSKLPDQSWDLAMTQEFELAKSYELKNMSHSTAYLFRAAAMNAAGYSDYTEPLSYTTHSLQVASVIADGGASSLVVSSLALLVSFLLVI